MKEIEGNEGATIQSLYVDFLTQLVRFAEDFGLDAAFGSRRGSLLSVISTHQFNFALQLLLILDPAWPGQTLWKDAAAAGRRIIQKYVWGNAFDQFQVLREFAVHMALVLNGSGRRMVVELLRALELDGAEVSRRSDDLLLTGGCKVEVRKGRVCRVVKAFPNPKESSVRNILLLLDADDARVASAQTWVEAAANPEGVEGIFMKGAWCTAPKGLSPKGGGPYMKVPAIALVAMGGIGENGLSMGAVTGVAGRHSLIQLEEILVLSTFDALKSSTTFRLLFDGEQVNCCRVLTRRITRAVKGPGECVLLVSVFLGFLTGSSDLKPANFAGGVLFDPLVNVAMCPTPVKELFAAILADFGKEDPTWRRAVVIAAFRRVIDRFRALSPKGHAPLSFLAPALFSALEEPLDFWLRGGELQTTECAGGWSSAGCKQCGYDIW
jgi:hypothetical protein